MAKTPVSLLICATVSITSGQGLAGVCDVFSRLVTARKGHSNPVAELNQILSSKWFSGSKVIDLLSRDKKIKKLFKSDAGVGEKYSIREHTQMVYEVFAKELPYHSAKLKGPDGVDVVRVLKFTIAVHDIGKPIAIQKARKDDQHTYTIPILVQTMKKYGFSKPEIGLAKAVVENDVMGLLSKGKITVDQAQTQIESLAKSASMNPRDYFYLQKFFFTSDAAAYPTLRRNVFGGQAGSLEPLSKRIHELERRFTEQ